MSLVTLVTREARVAEQSAEVGGIRRMIVEPSSNRIARDRNGYGYADAGSRYSRQPPSRGSAMKEGAFSVAAACSASA